MEIQLEPNLKIRIFTATVESILLYGCETWTLNKTTEKMIDGTYTRLLRSALNVSWRDHVPNIILYGNLSKIRERRMSLAGHCVRHKEEEASKLVIWNPITRGRANSCLLYTSPSPRDGLLSRMPSSA